MANIGFGWLSIEKANLISNQAAKFASGDVLNGETNACYSNTSYNFPSQGARGFRVLYLKVGLANFSTFKSSSINELRNLVRIERVLRCAVIARLERAGRAPSIIRQSEA